MADETKKTAVRQPWVLAPISVTQLTVANLRELLDAHDHGTFDASAALADSLGRHAEVGGALEQRLAGAPGLPFELEAADQSTNASGLRDRIAARWSRSFPVGSQRALLRDRVLMGFAVARLTGAYDPTLDEVVPYVERWHPGLCRLDRSTGRWLARDTDLSEVVLVDEFGRVAEGWAVSFVGDRLSTHLEGCVRALGEPFLGSQLAARDARRHSERMGQGILEAQVPAAQAETDEAKRFTKQIARVGSAGVVVTPQYLDDAQSDEASASYGVKLHFPPGSGMSGLLQLDDHETQRLRLRILGQDTTSKDSKGGGYARAAVGAGVRQDLLEADAKALREFASQLFDGWALLEGRPRRLFPSAKWDATPPEDREREARTRQANGAAIGALVNALPALQSTAKTAGLEVDVKELFERFGVPTIETTPENTDG
jgi:hypothetical protein